MQAGPVAVASRREGEGQKTVTVGCWRMKETDIIYYLPGRLYRRHNLKQEAANM